MEIKNYKNALQHPIFEHIAQAAEELQLDAYVIGGFVRDFLLQRGNKKDIDVVAIGSGIDLALRVSELLPHKPKVQVFKNFGTAMLRYGDTDIEFVGARKESYTENSRKPAVENGTLTDDQNRRDFTINALALSLNRSNYGDLLDPFNGVDDLQKGLIRTPLDADITYSDDPLRMLRAIRFATQLNFVIEAESLAALARNAYRIDIISGERIVEEINKILLCDQPSRGFLLLHQTQLLERILPELTALEGVDEAEGQTHKDNFYHTLEVVDNICQTTDDLWLRWSALLHDIGKAPTKRYHPKNGWSFHGHEFLGGKMVKKLFQRLHMPMNHKMKYVVKMVQMSSRPIVLAQDIVTDSAVRRLVFDAGEDVEDLMKLCEADITTKNPRKFQKYHANFKIVREKIQEVEERDRIRNFQPPVSGEEIMELFGIGPSREIGMLKEAVKEAILDGTIPNDYTPAKAFVIEKGTALGLTLQS